jgi:hypothetical protein
MHCWHFCDGWTPERWVVYAALYPVADWHAVVDLMSVIRSQLHHKAAQRTEPE